MKLEPMKRNLPISKRYKDYLYENEDSLSIQSGGETISSEEEEEEDYKKIIGNNEDWFKYQQKLIDYQKFHLKRIRISKSKNSIRKHGSAYDSIETDKNRSSIIQPITIDTVFNSLEDKNNIRSKHTTCKRINICKSLSIYTFLELRESMSTKRDSPAIDHKLLQLRQNKSILNNTERTSELRTKIFENRPKINKDSVTCKHFFSYLIISFFNFFKKLKLNRGIQN